MKGLILAGGKSTRLYPLTFNLPKPMVPVLNRPFLEHMIEWLHSHGIRDIILTTCYLPDAIREHFKSGADHGVNIEYVIEERPLGTGGAIKNCEQLLDGTFYVFNGDILTGLDLRDMARKHERSGAKVSISLTYVEDPTPYGVIETDESGHILRFREKPKPHEITSHYINAGTYVFEPEALAEMPAEKRFSIEREFYPQALERGVPMFGYRDSSYWLDIGTAEKYVQAHRDILSGRLPRRGAGEEVQPGMWAGPGVHVDPDATVVPPAVMGERCVIKAGATVGPYAVLGHDVHVEAGARVVDSVLWNGTVVGAGATLTRCVVGRRVRVDPGVCLDGGAVGDRQHVTAQGA
ncbi:MAG: NDP-sugar synthase [Armatimonadota bacterium]|nr:MAG: NDP-sugar synthase [Armatimonadota bacterium]